MPRDGDRLGLADIGGLISGDELAERIRQQCLNDAGLRVSQPVSLVARWIVSRAVVSIDSPWGHMLPFVSIRFAPRGLAPRADRDVALGG